MLEDGYNPADNSTNPEEILAYKVVINALNDALSDLTEEKLRACQMVAQENLSVKSLRSLVFQEEP